MTTPLPPDVVSRLEAACAAVLGWALQERAGLRPLVSDPAVRVGAVAVLRLGLGQLALHAPVRVVAVVEEPERRGFAYGTLPGHPEQGEERFVVSRGLDGAVHLEIVAFSRPGGYSRASPGRSAG